jgi:hypothetical protein
MISVRRIATCGVVAAAAVCAMRASAADVVISQIYPGGGTSGATYRSDFVEIFNRGGAAVDLSGWSVQITSGSGTTWQVTGLSGSLAPGQYYLVQEFTASGGSQNLPPADAMGTININNFSAKVALVSSMTALSGSCPLGGAVDLVGYQIGVSCYEGAPIDATASNVQAFVRQSGGCTETDDNFQDFRVAGPVPRSRTAPLNLCTLRGACCHDETCSLETATDCSSRAGNYQGDGSSCAACPPRPCSSIGGARALPAGSGVRLCGAVVSTTTDLSISSAEKSLQLQDDTGGITLRGPNVAIDQIAAQAALGHSINIEGMIAQENGLTVLRGPYSAIVDNGFIGVPAAQTVTSADFPSGGAGETYESEIVAVRCVYFANNQGQSLHVNGSYQVRDAAGPVTISIQSSELENFPVPSAEVTITGIFYQANSYFLVPRTPADIVVSPECAPFGSCCIPLPDCILTTEVDCAARQGTYHGAHTTCASNPCMLPCFGHPRGDTNGDGVVNLFDIDAFVQAIAEQCGNPLCLCGADCNCDGVANNFDIDAFVRCLTQGCDTCNP